MKPSILLLALVLLFSGCYTQLVTYETEVDVPESGTVTIVNNDMAWYRAYNGFYTPWYTPYRTYLYPFRIHRPIWQPPVHKVPPRHVGTKPKEPPKHDGLIKPPPPRRDERYIPTYTPPPTGSGGNAQPAPAPSSGGNRSSGATRSK